MKWLAALAAGTVSGTLGALGLGGGSVLILYLTLFADVEQVEAQGINLLFFLPCAAVAVLLHAKSKLICRRLWLWATPVGVVGAIFGAWLANYLDSALIGRIFAGLLLIYGSAELFHRRHGRKNAEKKPCRRKQSEAGPKR